MGLVLGKSKALMPKGVKEIKHLGHPEKRCIEMSIEIAKQFGIQAKKMKPKKKVYFR